MPSAKCLSVNSSLDLHGSINAIMESFMSFSVGVSFGLLLLYKHYLTVKATCCLAVNFPAFGVF